MLDFLIRLRSEGGQIRDLAGNAWTNTNVVAQTDGLYFNANSRLDLSVSSSNAKVIRNGSDFTFSCWVYQEQNNQYASVILQLMDNIVIHVKNPENNGYGGVGDVVSSQWKIYNISESLYQLGKWIHIGLVRYNGVITLYLNGKSVGSATNWISGDITITRCYIGYANFSPSNSMFKGYLQDVCLINNRALWTSNFTPPQTFLSNLSNMYVDNGGGCIQ